jgi:hypothetical protein
MTSRTAIETFSDHLKNIKQIDIIPRNKKPERI